MTYAFLPMFKEQKSGQIINVSSGQAYFRLPTWGAYAAVKLMVGALSEIWHFELKRDQIHMLTVYPYMVIQDFMTIRIQLVSLMKCLVNYYLIIPMHTDQVAKESSPVRKSEKGKKWRYVESLG